MRNINDSCDQLDWRRRIRFSHDRVVPALPRLASQRLLCSRRSHPRKPRPPSTTTRFPRQTTSPTAHCSGQAVLGGIATAMGWTERTSHPGHTQNRCHPHRAGFRLYWKWLSRVRSRGGRKPVSKEIRALIFRMVAESPTWGAPRIHGELLELGCADDEEAAQNTEDQSRHG